jgi:Mg2+-importing ATPase
VVAIAIGLPFTKLGGFFGFVAPPVNFYLALFSMVIMYLLIVQWVKKIFYKQVFLK